MSQKSHSPKSPVSEKALLCYSKSYGNYCKNFGYQGVKQVEGNSSSCHVVASTESEENQRPRTALDQIQRQVEEELRQSNRLLVAIDGLIAESKGSISENYSRPRSAHDEGTNFGTTSRMSVESEICSPPSEIPSSYNAEMEVLKLPSPPQSIITFGSQDRDPSRGGSRRGTRLPSPETFSVKSRAKSPSILTNQNSSNPDYNVDETKNPSAATRVPSGKGSRTSSPCCGNPSRMSRRTPQEQLSFDENNSLSKKSHKSSLSRYLNESNEPHAQTVSCHGRGTRAGSPPCASKHVKDVATAESGQNYHVCLPRPVICPETQFLMYDEDMKSVGMESDHYDIHESPRDFFGRDETAKAALGHLSQLKKTPSYFRCGLQQGTEFLNVCCPKVKDARRTEGKVTRLPKSPCLISEDIDDLIRCETSDVESAWYLTSDAKKTHKKPCPKQQKAQLTVKSIVQTYATQTGGIQIYSPLEHPEPEDISPEVAAAMMFSQEQGIGIEECPNAIIAHLFPDEQQSMTPEKGTVSVVDPSQKDQEDMIEKSAAVPSEGVSDSAYTRTMREKGGDVRPQRSYYMDFAVCQSKPEYVLVPQKPQRVSKVQFRGNSPPWFPGYFSAFPDDEGLKVVSSPSRLFHKAWVYSNPENIPASDMIVLE